MRVFIQWARATPADYEVYDFGAGANVIRNLPNKAEPLPGEGEQALDEQAGWIAKANIQGVQFEGYRTYGFTYDRQQRILDIYSWADHVLWDPDGPYGVRWTFEFPRNDPNLGTINTVQSRIFYATPGSAWATSLDQAGISWSAWSTITLPPTNQRRWGPWLTAAQLEAHRAVRNEHVWDEWVEEQGP